MYQQFNNIRRVLRSTALCGMGALLLTPFVAHAFNPDEGEQSTATTTTIKRARPLPSTAPLMAPMPKLVFAEPPANRQVPSGNMNATAPVQGSSTSYVVPAPAPQFPPVDPAVAAQAQRELTTTTPVQNMPPAVIAAPPHFVAPAPLSSSVGAATPVATSSSVNAATPVVSSSVGALSPAPGIPARAIVPVVADNLSPASKSILGKIPSKIDAPKPATGKLTVNRMSPDIKAINKDPKVDTYDSVGLSIKVARPGLDTNYELNRAYTSLMGGDTQTAIETYKNILSTEPDNQDALFGLAATYHRLGDIEHARPYYGELLKVNPGHREGLNNFLALVSDESPNEALAELERLEQRNPDFSPIPAQQAIVLTKLGYHEQAREKMIRAIELAPENLTYKYNLAVMLDRRGNYVDASAIYRLLIEASLNGGKVPASTESMQKRLNFITTAVAPKATVGG